MTYYRIRTTTVIEGSHRSAVKPERLHETLKHKYITMQKLIMLHLGYKVIDTLNGIEATRGIETTKIELEPVELEPTNG